MRTAGGPSPRHGRSEGIADEVGTWARVIVPDGVPEPAPHERRTAVRLARHGKTVIFRGLVDEPHVKNPDADMDGHPWEFKSPTGSSEKNTISEQFKSARGQADRLVIDLDRIGLNDEVAIEQIGHRFAVQNRFIELIVLTGDGQLIHFRK